MREVDYYLDDIKYEQGTLFTLATKENKDLTKFIPAYFRSSIHKGIEAHNPRFACMSAEDIYEQVQDLTELYAKEDPLAAWYGQTYATISSELNIPSDVLYDLYPLKRLKNLFDADPISSIVKYSYKFNANDKLLAPSEFKINGQVFTTVAQYYNYRQATFAKDFELADEILAQPSVKHRKVKKLDHYRWAQIKDDILYTGVYNKVQQSAKHPEYENCLLVYESKDTYLGIGEADSSNPDTWVGHNALGVAFMRALNWQGGNK